MGWRTIRKYTGILNKDLIDAAGSNEKIFLLYKDTEEGLKQNDYPIGYYTITTTISNTTSSAVITSTGVANSGDSNNDIFATSHFIHFDELDDYGKVDFHTNFNFPKNKSLIDNNDSTPEDFKNIPAIGLFLNHINHNTDLNKSYWNLIVSSGAVIGSPTIKLELIQRKPNEL